MKGLIHIYHGDGKGKTTCGMGLCCRAAGAGKRVLIYQFMKDGEANERNVLEQIPGITYANERRRVLFSFQMSDAQKREEQERYRSDFLSVISEANGDGYDVLFLDEVLYAIESGLLEERELTEFLDQKPEGLEVILTGRNPSDEVRQRADYISEIRKEKHPYDRGILARDGIER